MEAELLEIARLACWREVGPEGEDKVRLGCADGEEGGGGLKEAEDRGEVGEAAKVAGVVDGGAEVDAGWSWWLGAEAAGMAVTRRVATAKMASPVALTDSLANVSHPSDLTPLESVLERAGILHRGVPARVDVTVRATTRWMEASRERWYEVVPPS